MHKNATKCNETLSKGCENKHGASIIIDAFETYHCIMQLLIFRLLHRCYLHLNHHLSHKLIIQRRLIWVPWQEVGLDKYTKRWMRSLMMTLQQVCHFVGTPSAECCSKRNFPIWVTWGLYRTLREQRRSFFLSCLATCKVVSLSCAPNSTVWLSSTRLLY
jgi:hypothetical protein